MTSSLVGSEMCIRDRLCIVIGHTPEAEKAVLYQAQNRRASNAIPRPKACLLYTSDAADDM
eukprot:11530721-Prorocentrum_lima.AAC.1